LFSVTKPSVLPGSIWVIKARNDFLWTAYSTAHQLEVTPCRGDEIYQGEQTIFEYGAIFLTVIAIGINHKGVRTVGGSEGVSKGAGARGGRSGSSGTRWPGSSGTRGPYTGR
jgi:hypothetical protein